MARAIDLSMPALVAMERQLWMNLSDIKEMFFFLLVASLSLPGFFGDDTIVIIQKFQEAKKELEVMLLPSQNSGLWGRWVRAIPAIN